MTRAKNSYQNSHSKLEHWTLYDAGLVQLFAYEHVVVFVSVVVVVCFDNKINNNYATIYFCLPACVSLSIDHLFIYFIILYATYSSKFMAN